MSKRISIGSWAYTMGPYRKHPIDFDAVCARLAELGFDGVELGTLPPHPNPDALPQKSQRSELRARLNELRLGFSGIAPNLWGERLIDTGDPGGYIAGFKKYAEFAMDLGIGCIRVDTVAPPAILRAVDYETAARRVVKAWKTCADIASDYGLYVTWEFEPGFAFNKPGEIVRIHDAVDRSNFGLLYDTCHGQMCGVVGARQEGAREVFPSQVEFLRTLSGRINHVHVIDSDNTCHQDDAGNDETSAHPPFGLGVIDFDAVMPALAAASRPPDDWWTIDLCFWPEAWEATAAAKQFADGLAAKYGS